MHWIRPLAALSAAGLLLIVVGCARDITGNAQVDAATAPLAVSEDGFGIVAGFDDAPAKIEIYTEPQCTHCRDLQDEFGDLLAYHITVGTLQVTYRPLVFMDADYDGYSSTVANALFLATDVVGDAAGTGTQLQRFVHELWANQDPGGAAFTGQELRDMAVGAGLPDAVADHVADGGQAVDVAAMDDTNFVLLFDIDSTDTGTPTVFDLGTGQKIDIYDDDWLSDLVDS
ncbi:DsbA family protein [Mycobacterium sp. smrl_JER01]|uniref:DsbA family protein n=1 Tax=Mycobacterium sp. smrl_JER01 TaxID=3402633 RepID=UPI003AC867F9